MTRSETDIHELNLDYPEQNVDGMMVFRDNNIDIGEELFDILTIFKPLKDPRDYKLTKLVLGADGESLTLTEPSVPSYFVDTVDQIHAQETQDEEEYKGTRKQHRVLATLLKNDDKRKLKSTVFVLPYGIKLKLDHFGNTLSKLQANYRCVKVKLNSTRKAEPSYMWWKIIIDGESRKLKDDAAAEEDDPFERAHQRMSGLAIDD